ncbi:MAG: NADH-quinone oxidoreductase subunit NuoE [Bryobacteraceae bacterium]
MRFSEQTEARLERLMASCPPGHERSALVPMLLFIQDETGAVTSEVIEEVCRRLGVSGLDVEEVVSYYSMLRRKPAGRYHIQICTNISCMLAGGAELFEHACRKLGIGNHGVTTDGMFSLEEVECIGACCWGPAMQVNYEFHHHVTPEAFDQLIEQLRGHRQGSSGQ